MKIFWIILGWCCVAIAVVGIALPGLPTTGPLLLALACFSKGSQRLHDWLFHHKVFGPPLQRWKEQRIIPLRAKILALVMMTGSIAIVCFVAPLPPWGVIVTVAVILVGMVVVALIPHQP